MSERASAALGRVAIVGAGQVGTLLGMALMANRRAAGVEAITLFDHDPATAAESLARGAGDAAGVEVSDAFGADVVVLAVPVPEIVTLVDRFGPMTRPGALVIDTGSAKRAVVEAMLRSIPPHAHAIGGHPMVGTERPGPAGADPDRLAGATFVLSAVRPDDEGLARARAFVEAVGGRALLMDAEAHDRAVAFTSHLPHLLAFALAGSAEAAAGGGGIELGALVSTGFLGATRLAESDPGTTAGFLGANAEEVTAAASRFRDRFDAMVSALADPASLERLFLEGRAGRRALTERVEP
jgi:prephenate dehydrogenase